MVRHSISKLLAVAIALSCLTSLGSGAHAQDEDIETWEAGFFPVSVTYNGDLWGNRSTSSFEGNERMQLSARATVFTLQAFSDNELDGVSCLMAYLNTIEAIEAVSNLEEFEIGEMPIGVRGADEILVKYDFLWPGREAPVPMVQYLSCQVIEPGSLLLIGLETRAGIYDEEIEIMSAILDGVEIDA